MAGLRAWVRDLFSKPRRLPARPFSAPSTTTLPASSRGWDPDASIVAANASSSQADILPASVDDHNAFAAALFGELRSTGGNLCFSPFSVRSALAMTYAGARGNTAAEMRRALYVSVSDPALHASCADMLRSFDAGSGAACEMAVANSLWSQIGAQLEPAFVELIGRQYGGSVQPADFRGGADAVRATVNQWVEDRTRGRIRAVLPPDQPRADTRLILVNAVYFKAKWTLRFRKDRTRDEPFFLDAAGEVLAPLMRQSAEVRYLKGPDYQAVELPYEGDRLSMLVFLPDHRDGLRQLETTLSAQSVKDCLNAPRSRHVAIFLPRFKMTWGAIDLRLPLEALGMRSAFTEGQADFSGMNGRRPPHEDSLYVAAVLHKAFVEVNEEGTEAAAATMVMSVSLGIPASEPPTPIFRADHPFVFVICDRTTGAIVFVGRVVDPTQQS